MNARGTKASDVCHVNLNSYGAVVLATTIGLTCHVCVSHHVLYVCSPAINTMYTYFIETIVLAFPKKETLSATKMTITCICM